eukprot:CAMPEP_0180289430 /NCGR_PEP_ID=MMETSP0988-20121125/14727_1 /TAXON_ID=697907 /ORGANISM="non described non described, Strain CCMP2293" /LENGTH=87 /DNA_ID=CAMNT_0022264473 /DNA_START=635 /DNA_END=895 /DNA_ORIENTATION=+
MHIAAAPRGLAVSAELATPAARGARPADPDTPFLGVTQVPPIPSSGGPARPARFAPRQNTSTHPSVAVGVLLGALRGQGRGGRGAHE